jgi:hypothetical protein
MWAPICGTVILTFEKDDKNHSDKEKKTASK